MLLRPGIVSVADIEALIGPVQRGGESAEGSAHASPGQHARHYRPRTPLFLVDAGGKLPDGDGAYLWHQTARAAKLPIQMPAHAAEYAARLYGTLHELDHRQLDWIAVEGPPADPRWEAIHDRLRRAAFSH